MPSVLRESSDTGAPVLTTTAGSINNLLKTVLVTGYGSKAALGWSVVFEDLATHQLVLRGGSGTQFPVKFSDNISEGAFRYTFVECFESMSDINTGYMQCPTCTDKLYQHIVKSVGNSTSTGVDWKIVGDDKGFWLLTRFYQSSSGNAGYGLVWQPHYIGDYTSLSIKNKWNFMTLLSHTNRSCYFYPASPSEISWVMRNPETLKAGSMKVNWTAFHSGSHWGNAMKTYGVSPIDGRYLYEPVNFWINDRPYGTLPGFLNMMWRSLSINTSINTYYQTNAEMTTFFEESDNKKVIVFPMKYLNLNPSNSHSQRGSIIIGEGFRDAR